MASVHCSESGSRTNETTFASGSSRTASLPAVVQSSADRLVVDIVTAPRRDDAAGSARERRPQTLPTLIVVQCRNYSAIVQRCRLQTQLNYDKMARPLSCVDRTNRESRDGNEASVSAHCCFRSCFWANPAAADFADLQQNARYRRGKGVHRESQRSSDWATARRRDPWRSGRPKSQSAAAAWAIFGPAS